MTRRQVSCLDYNVLSFEEDEELLDYILNNRVLAHYGTPRHSGRYPWGSGENPYQHNAKFLHYYNSQKKKGVSETEIAKALGYKSSVELRARVQAASNNNRKEDVAYAMKLREKGMSYRAIGEKMGRNESSVRSLLNPNSKSGSDETDVIISELKKGLEKTGYLDVGAGSELYLNGKKGVSRDKLEKALILIQDEGYVVDTIYVKQAGFADQNTTVQVLAKKGTDKKDIYNNMYNISTMADIDPDIDAIKKTQLGIYKPRELERSRIQVRYAEDGGEAMDGVIEIRRGLKDINLGKSNYAQVRIAVEGDRYMKGMAVYADDLPPGVDVRYNSNKKKGSPDSKVFKSMQTKENGEIDWDNPFGATIMEGGQTFYKDKDGKEQLSYVNKINDEGTWDDWSSSTTLASQMLGKQPVSLAKNQLKIAYSHREQQFEEIMQNTNPTVKRYLLEEFGNECDTAAVNLKAAALPRQSAKVILPVPSLKSNEIYAPSYKDGETVVLIRYPHGGRFEIPELIVNNRNKEAKARITPGALDAVGINKDVADRLSGADFDGDSVIVIPNNRGEVKTMAPLEELKGFDTKKAYPKTEGCRIMKESEKQMQMGMVSNLITDMTLQDAKPEELARAVKHSMVVIDAVKHELNYEKSYIDNGIAELKKKYQPNDKGGGGGASTLLSLAKNPTYIEKRQGSYRIDPDTGEKIWKTSAKSWTDSKGGVHYYKQEVDKMSLVKDAYELSSGTEMESVYADFANSMKALGNRARKESLGLKLVYDKEAAKMYSNEVESLNSKLKLAKMNAPKERQAQILANKVADEKILELNVVEPDKKKKIKRQSIAAARAQVGAKKSKIDITPKEWEAISKGAISDTKLRQILVNTDETISFHYHLALVTKTINCSYIMYQLQKTNIFSLNHSLGDLV